MSALEAVLAPDLWRIADHPRDLAKIISGTYGVIPEASITYVPTGNVMYFEVKKQGPAGNADERACKHHTVAFQALLHQVSGLPYHPFVTIMCENLATDARYTVKHPAYFEEDHYFCWVDYDLESLREFIERISDRWLAVEADPRERRLRG